MKPGSPIAGRFREIISEGTWVAGTNFKAQLADLDWQQASRKIDSLNTIAVLTSHIHYYIAGIVNVLDGGTLDIRDQFSFDFPPVQSQEDWQQVKNKFWNDAEKFARLVEELTEEELQGDFTNKKYGSYQRNIDAMIEHCYYHLGQIVLLKKMVSTL